MPATASIHSQSSVSKAQNASTHSLSTPAVSGNAPGPDLSAARKTRSETDLTARVGRSRTASTDSNASRPPRHRSPVAALVVHEPVDLGETSPEVSPHITPHVTPEPSIHAPSIHAPSIHETPPSALNADTSLDITTVPTETAHALTRGTLEFVDTLNRPEHAQQRRAIEVLGESVLKGLGHARDGLRFVTENRATSKAGQIASSVFNIGLRNTASVGVTTEVRQLMSAAIREGFDKHLSAEAQTALALTVIGIPIALNLIGAMVDHHSNTGNARSWTGRSLNLMLGVSAIALALKAGTTADTAAQCVSTFLYCAIRDAVQSCMRLPDESPGQNATAVVATGGLYVGNQYAVNRGMTVYGSPSGVSAAGKIGERWPKDVVRAGINTAGETVDDIVDVAVHAFIQGKPFRVGLEVGLPTKQQALDKLLRMGSARPDVFLSSLMLGHLVDECLVGVEPKDRDGLMATITAAVPGADKCLIPPDYLPKGEVSKVSDAVFAVLIGMLRIPQVLQAGQSDRPAPADAPV